MTTPEVEVASRGLGQSKASSVRGIVEVLRRERTFDQVLNSVSADSRELMLHPPAASAWIPSTRVEPIMDAVLACSGPNACRRVVRDASLLVQVPMMTSMLSGLLRVFGSTPHTLYMRVHDQMKLIRRGCHADYMRVGEKACRLRVTFLAQSVVSQSTALGLAGGLEIPLLVTNVRGTVSDPIKVTSSRDDCYDFEIAWQ